MDLVEHTDTIAALMDRIRNAYKQIANSSQWVKLSDLRPYVGGNRELVDEALRRLSRTQEISLVPESNQKALTDADREAAVWHGNQHKHLILIDYR